MWFYIVQGKNDKSCSIFDMKTTSSNSNELLLVLAATQGSTVEYSVQPSHTNIIRVSVTMTTASSTATITTTTHTVESRSKVNVDFNIQGTCFGSK